MTFRSRSLVFIRIYRYLRSVSNHSIRETIFPRFVRLFGRLFLLEIRQIKILLIFAPFLTRGLLRSLLDRLNKSELSVNNSRSVTPAEELENSPRSNERRVG